jgi:hypothetical protein
MKKQFLFFLSITSILLYCISCKKGPGAGGEASIRGKVSGILYDKSFTAKLDSGYVGNWTVNILYGDDVAIDANQKTSFDGSFEFQYLRKGHYTVFVYSRSYKTNLPDSALVLEADISEKKQVLDLPVIKIFH